jgi:hypothetical protein
MWSFHSLVKAESVGFLNEFKMMNFPHEVKNSKTLTLHFRNAEQRVLAIGHHWPLLLLETGSA